ncbi:MAG: thiamine phosphate synthase [Gammaproteobacteria bacterium]|nr:thiamine phosphate synthase [Gammaproteobacteria bacterium]
MNLSILHLCLVTHIGKTPLPQYTNFLKKAISGGVTCIQLREKTRDYNELYVVAKTLQKFLRPLKIPLIINDHIEIAKAVDADGVHLGQNDLSPYLARKILGPDKIIGWSVESLTDVVKANNIDAIDYIGASAIFPSKSKPNCKMIWGLEGLSKIVNITGHPIMAIGGINKNNIGSVINRGASGAAVIGAIHDYPDALEAAKDLSLAIKICMEDRDSATQNKVSLS